MHSVPARRQTTPCRDPVARAWKPGPVDGTGFWSGPTRRMGGAANGRNTSRWPFGTPSGQRVLHQDGPPGHTHQYKRASGKGPPQCPSHRHWHLRLVPLRTRRKVVPDPERLFFVTKGDRMLEHLPIPRHEDQVAQVPNDTIGRELLGTIHKPILPGLADPHPCLGTDVPCRPGSGNIARDRQARRRYGSPRIHWPA